MPTRNRRVLLTGVNGLLGQKLVPLIADEDAFELIATGRGSNRNPEGAYRYLEADLTSQDQVKHLMDEVCPNQVIHCAAMTQVDECELNPEACLLANVDATQYLLQAAIDLPDIHFCYVSTDFIFDGREGPYHEGSLPNPISVYGRSKLEAEALVRESGITHAIVRTVLVYGVAYDPSRSNIVLWVKSSLEAGKAIRVVDDQVRTPTLAEDLAMASWQVCKGNYTGDFHISGGETFTPYQLALRVAAHFHLDDTLISPVTADTFSQPGKRPPKTGFIIDKARAILGYTPTPLEQGLELVANQLQDNELDGRTSG